MGSLPDAYVESMKELLGEEYRQYLDSFSQSPFAAFRINTIKISVERDCSFFCNGGCMDKKGVLL